MTENGKPKRLVGPFIRLKREEKNLSQRALGMLFIPPVTTQFISNMERGVTPLPPAHIPTLVKILSISENELTQLLEKEYMLKLSERLGTAGGAQAEGIGSGLAYLPVSASHLDFFKSLYEKYSKAPPNTQQELHSRLASLINSG